MQVKQMVVQRHGGAILPRAMRLYVDTVHPSKALDHLADSCTLHNQQCWPSISNYIKRCRYLHLHNIIFHVCHNLAFPIFHKLAFHIPVCHGFTVPTPFV